MMFGMSCVSPRQLSCMTSCVVLMMKVKMMSGDEVARLIIYGITPDDAGAYSISVSNAFGQASDVVNVNVVGKLGSVVVRASDL